MNKRIYLDHAATTPVSSEVLNAMLPYFSTYYGNPGGVHSFARQAKAALDQSRATVAKAINARPEEVYFNCGGSEGDNLILLGAARARKEKGGHIITSKIEHHAVLHTCEALEREGFEVTYLDVDEEGLVSPQSVEEAIRPDTFLVSIMMANNEIGTIQPIAEIGKVCRERNILFHTDAVQAFGSVKIDVEEMNVDFLTMTAHKIYGPKGVGAMYIRKGIKVAPTLFGGGQERGRRPGTENIAGIVGLAKAVEIAEKDRQKNCEYLRTLRDELIDGILEKIPQTRLNGSRENRLPNNANFCFEYIEGESLLLLLDTNGIAASSGSACTAGSLEPSHVLLALGLSHEIAHGSLRLTLGKDNTKEDIEEVLRILPGIVQRLREMSPLFYKGGTKGVQ